ncbi:MAG: TonB-dependent receptor [Alphaproteobacteria bacterium]
MTEDLQPAPGENVPGTIEKALSINLDPLKYGTIVEIGAGQEVARWFFQAGAAAGTVAKTMSAYDMKFSDEIYGTVAGGRYVSRPRLERMLEQQYDLIISRIEEHRPDESRFFAFANTVAAQGFKKRSECHGWLGVRLQAEPQGEPDDIILHVRMLDDTNLEQQEALGILGVNLIYGAYTYTDDPERLLRSLMDNLKWGRVEIDLVEFRGPVLGQADNARMALELVKASLTRAVLFNPEGDVMIPAEALYKKSVLGMRGDFQALLDEERARFAHARDIFCAETGCAEDETLFLAEMTMAEGANIGDIDTADFLSRVRWLNDARYYVLISEFFRYFRVRQYFARYTEKPVGIVTDVRGFEHIMGEEFYDGLDGGILEGLGKLFPPGTTAYVYPGAGADRNVGFDGHKVAPHLKPLVEYLRERRQVVPVDEFEFSA